MPQPGRLKQQNVFSHSSGGRKSKTKALAALVPPEASVHCVHQGLAVNREFFDMVASQNGINDTGLLSGLYGDSRYFCSVWFSRSVVSDYLRPHESQHARPPCPSPTPGVHSDSRPSSQLCHSAISSSVVLFFSCPQSHPASESFPMSELFA